MLVLSRKVGERIRMGGNMELVVTEIRGDRVRLGINAPPDVSIHREEVYQRLQQEQNAARPASAADRGERLTTPYAPTYVI